MGQEFIERSNYFFSQTPADVKGARLLRVAHEKWGPKYEVFRPSSLAIGLAFILKGKCTFKTNDNTWMLKKGYIAAFGPGPSYSIKCDKNNPPEIMIVSYCGSNHITLTNNCLGGTCLAVNPHNPHEISAIYELMFSSAKNHRFCAEEICNSLVSTLLWTINRGMLEKDRNYSPAKSKYNECKQFIDKNFLTINSINEVAIANNTSHVHLCRLFNKYASVTPNAYYLKLKINYASNLLQFTNKPIKMISAELGFSDQYVFSKTFKRMTNISPQYFRNSC